jgi:hypothetical protein
LYIFLLVHQLAELYSCQSADEAKQNTERQRTSDDATYQDGYEYYSGNGPLDKILHIYAF